MPATDAFFESMSGITTTGSTVLSGLDETPHGILLWRAMLQALGGIGFVVTGVALLPVLKVGGMQLFRSESSEQGEKELANSARFALATLAVYGALMGGCFLAYLAGGMSVFDATVHAMTTLSTGGYSNYDASFGHFDSAFLQYAATGFMALGGVPFAWYIRAVLKRRYGSEQIGRYLQFLAAVIALLTVWLVLTTDVPPETAFRQVAFSVVSVVTTTGLCVGRLHHLGRFRGHRVLHDHRGGRLYRLHLRRRQDDALGGVLPHRPARDPAGPHAPCGRCRPLRRAARSGRMWPPV